MYLILSWTVCILSYYLFCVEGVIEEEQPPMVRISTGLVRGEWKDSPVSEKRLKSFRGIPYGQPPIGNLRFKPPVPAKPWDHVFDATKTPPFCLQKKSALPFPSSHFEKFFPSTKDSDPSEDCLNLDVIVPEGIEPKTPVVIWLYGGGFARGASSGKHHDVVTFTAQTNVVTVIFNYRLNVFGFLYFNDSEAPGNVGMMDQVLAFKWVQQNIASFGGDPEQVTLAGYSAGAASIGLHLLLPESRPLFKRAIMESGTPHSAFTTESRDEVIKKSFELAENVGCATSPVNVRSILKCLREKRADDLLDNQPQYGYDHVYLFRPVVDGVFLKDHPVNLLKNETFFKENPVDIISGTNKDESSMFLAAFYPYRFTMTRNAVYPTWDEIRFIIKDFFGISGVATDVILALYGYPDKREVASGAIALGTDLIFTCPAAQLERLVAQSGSKVYKYFFTHRTEHLTEKNVPEWLGVHHALELLYVFGEVTLPEHKYSDLEVNFAKRVLSYWGNFIKTGDPNTSPTGEDVKINWPRYTNANEEYLALAPNSSATGMFLRHKKCLFWDDIIPKLAKLQPDNGERGSLDVYRNFK